MQLMIYALKQEAARPGTGLSMLPGFPDGWYGVDARLREVPSPRLARPA